MSNLILWDKVEKRPPKHTKPITGKSYQGTSPKPHYIIRKATEMFGPCGIGWGFTFTERVECGAGEDKLHTAHVKVWYKWEGERGEVEHVGQTMLCGKRNNGKQYTDEDAPKKSVTDGLIKALSMIGFAGDIFMGRYDDSKYVQDLRNEDAADEVSQKDNKERAPSLDKDYSSDLLDCQCKKDLRKVLKAAKETLTPTLYSELEKDAAKMAAKLPEDTPQPTLMAG